MEKDTIVEILSILQCQNIPEGIRIRLENHRFPNWKQQKPSCSTEKLKIWKIEKEKFDVSRNVSGKSHRAENSKEGILWGF